MSEPWFEVNWRRDRLGTAKEWVLADPWGDGSYLGEIIPFVWANTTMYGKAEVVGHTPTGSAIIRPIEGTMS